MPRGRKPRPPPAARDHRARHSAAILRRPNAHARTAKWCYGTATLTGMDHAIEGPDALRLWAAFPVAALRRPLVLAGRTVREIGGFDSGEAKVAYLEGAIDGVERLSPGVVDAMCPQRSPTTTGLRLRVTAVRFSNARFLTDRGDQNLPVWEVALSHFDGVVTVLDPQVAAQAWRPPGQDSTIEAGSGMTAALHEDGRTLTLSFMGTPRAYADYPYAEVHESDTAALVKPVAVDRPEVTGLRLAYAEYREVTATLVQPLGARVLVTSGGMPVPVTRLT
jgi:hypothetical protein